MKTLKWIAVGILFLFNGFLHAQVSVNVNVGSPPKWAPAGYSGAEYYYIPDIESYYDVRSSQFIYLGGGKWIRERQLPLRYRNYDLYHGYKVSLTDYHGRTPYMYFKNHKVKYYNGYHGEPYRRSIVKNKHKHYKENHERKEHDKGHGKDKD